MTQGDMPDKNQTGERSAARQAVVVNLTSKDELYEAYMPFLQNGGLFLPTRGHFRLGQELSLMLNLMNEPEKIPVTAQVVWITPQGAHGRRAAGIGIQFSNDQVFLRDKIETYLAGRLNSQHPTHTL